MNTEGDTARSTSGVRELTGEYYTHKRSTLLASGLLFIISIHGLKLNGSTIWGPLDGVSSDVLRALVLSVATYYFVHFLNLHKEETISHTRSTDLGVASTAAELQDFASRLANCLAHIEGTQSDVQNALVTTTRKLPLEGPVVDITKLERTVFELLDDWRPGDKIADQVMQGFIERLRQSAGDRFDPEEWGALISDIHESIRYDPHMPELTKHLSEGLPPAILLKEHRATAVDLHNLSKVISARLSDVSGEIVSLRSEAKKVLGRLDATAKQRQFRLKHLDRDVPAALFVVAVAHYFGTIWPVFLPADEIIRWLVMYLRSVA